MTIPEGTIVIERTEKVWKAFMAFGVVEAVAGLLCLPLELSLDRWQASASMIVGGAVVFAYGRSCAWWFNG